MTAEQVSANDHGFVQYCDAGTILTPLRALEGGLIPGGSVLVFTLELIEVKGDYVQ